MKIRSGYGVVIKRYAKESGQPLWKVGLISFKLKFKMLIKSVSQINKLHLAINVYYNGKKYFVNNGTRCPKWDILSE